MPNYAYRCSSCGHTFDKVQKFSEPPRARCPRCRGRAERVITGGGGFLLKGEGFHATDYRSESYKKAAKSEGSAAAASEPKPEKEAASGSAAGAPAKGKDASVKAKRTSGDSGASKGDRPKAEN